VYGPSVVGRGFDSRRSHFAPVQSNTSTGVRRRGVGLCPIRLELLSGLRYWGLLIYGATLGMRTPCGLAFEDERVEGRAIVRVHILDPAALAISSQALCLFGRIVT